MIGRQGAVDELVGLAVGDAVLIEGEKAAVVLGELLLDDVGLDRAADVVGLTGEVGGHVEILALGLLLHVEGRVAQVAPKDGGHAELMGAVEGLGDLNDLAVGVRAAKVNRGADGCRAHLVGFLNLAEENLLERVRVGHELVVINLHNEGDLVGVLARRHAENAEGRGNRVAAAFNGKLDDVFGIEVIGILGEAGAAGVLDALVDGQDGHVARAREAACAVDAGEVVQDTQVAVAVKPHAVREIRAGQVKAILGDRLALVVK